MTLVLLSLGEQGRAMTTVFTSEDEVVGAQRGQGGCEGGAGPEGWMGASDTVT